jgi:ATP-dependent helicase YprA (DUF1998 family)
MKDKDRTTTEELAASRTRAGTSAETPATLETERGGATSATQAREDVSLLSEEDRADFMRRWEDIQVRFVDDPQGSVKEADALVAEVMQHLAGTFAEEKRQLEGQWSHGDESSTEDLRIAVQRYRAFVDRLLRA